MRKLPYYVLFLIIYIYDVEKKKYKILIQSVINKFAPL